MNHTIYILHKNCCSILYLVYIYTYTNIYFQINLNINIKTDDANFMKKKKFFFCSPNSKF